MSIRGQRIVLQRERFGLSLKLFELSCQILVCSERFPKADKGAHHIDAGLDSTITIEYGSRHKRAVLGECQRVFSDPAPAAL
jgi:hypothetical protein